MFEATFNAIDRVLWKEEGCNTELDYTEQASWLLFLKYLDSLEQDKATEAVLNGKKYNFILDSHYRWDTWAAPKNVDFPCAVPASSEAECSHRQSPRANEER